MKAERRGSALASTARLQGWVLQALLLLALGALCYELASNAITNLARQRIVSGFGFLDGSSGFAISQTPIPYTERSTYGRVLLVGLLNTLIVSVLGIVFATVIGFAVGIARLSRNWIIARLAGLYIEVIRNIPLLLQLFFWYSAVLANLPNPRQSYSLGDMVFLNGRGLFLPEPIPLPGSNAMLAALGMALLFFLLLRRWASWRQARTGLRPPVLLPSLVTLIALCTLTYLSSGPPAALAYPRLQGFNFVGGLGLIPELVALLLALSLYTASFIAEVVRGGILSVSRGQSEAAAAIGLTRSQTLRLIVLPLALRVIVPPLTNQYLNLTKNSSLAVAIGYPDLVSVFAGTVLNQTGQAIEVLTITMGVYLAISLATAGIMSWYNARIALVER